MKVKTLPTAQAAEYDGSTANLIGRAMLAIADAGGGVVEIEGGGERRSPTYAICCRLANVLLPAYAWSAIDRNGMHCIVGTPRGGGA